MTDADKIMHPRHFVTDPTDIRISKCKQDNWRTRIRTSTKLGRYGQGVNDPLEVIDFWWWFGSACGSGSLFHFVNDCGMGFSGHLSVFLIQLTADLYHTWQNDWRRQDNIMHPRHFETDPTDIRIWINPKIPTKISDHFWLKFWRWRRFALSECFCLIQGSFRPKWLTKCRRPATTDVLVDVMWGILGV